MDPPLQAVPEEDWFCPKCEAEAATGDEDDEAESSGGEGAQVNGTPVKIPGSENGTPNGHSQATPGGEPKRKKRRRRKVKGESINTSQVVTCRFRSSPRVLSRRYHRRIT
jgi:hypothetical protein